MSNRAEWWWILVAFLLLNLTYASSQPLTTINDGLGHEGRIYHAMAKGFPRQMPPHGTAPDVYRPGMPLLVAALAKSQDWVISAGFDRLNVIFNALSVIGLTLLLRRHVASASARLLVIIVFMIEPHSPVRYAYFSPMDITPATMAWLAAGLCAIGWYQLRPTLFRMGAVAVLVGMGVGFHEVVLVVAVCALFCAAPEQSSNDWRWLPLASGTASYLVLRLWTVETPSAFSGYDEIFRGLSEKSLLQYGLAWFLVFGPFLALPVIFWRQSVRFLVDRPVLLVYLSITAVLGWSIGGDAERPIVLASPVVYILIARAMELSRLDTISGAAVSLLLAQALSLRVFTHVGGPIDPPQAISEVWERLGSESTKWLLSYDNMWSRTCAPAMTAFYLAWYGVLGAGTTVFLWFRRADS